MERRLLLVFALTFVVILLSQPLLKKYFPQPVAPPAQSQPEAASTAPVAAAAAPAPVPAPSVGVSKQAAAESETVIENDLYRITFTNRGAQVKSWVLKKYKDSRGELLDLVNSTAAAKFGYPLSLWMYDETQRTKVNSVLYVADQPAFLRAPASVTFEYADADLAIRKTFRFDDSYIVQVETSVLSKGSPATALPLWPAGFGDETSTASYASSQIEHQYNGNTERLAAKKIVGGATLTGPFNWIGVTDQYFAAVFLPNNPQNLAVITLHNSIDIPKNLEKPNPNETTNVPVLGAGVGVLGGPTVERLYVGPKSLPVLESVSVPTISGQPQDLRTLVNFGFFGVIARPLFIWLRWTYEHWVPNWGWAIVVQTLIINFALVPLRISQIKSSLKMQKVQPQMKAIQEKYKKYGMRDPRRQEMNAEIGALMKREGANPVGGCLPVLIQMPFLFAYYSMLGAAIDLRQAHWLWISDLSSKDPYYVLPIVLIVSMLVTQRMMPQPGMDPAQQKMMNVMMPVMMGFIFMSLAAGLNLYYSESNLIQIAQQAIMNRTKLGREMREMALKRARKKEK